MVDVVPDRGDLWGGNLEEGDGAQPADRIGACLGRRRFWCHELQGCSALGHREDRHIHR